MKKLLLSLPLILLASGCASQPLPFSQAEAQTRLLQAETYYEVPLTLAVAYNQRPRCTVPVTVTLCSDPTAIAAIRKANAAVLVAFGKAADTVNTPNVTEDAVTAAIVAATNATEAFKQIVAVYTGVK